MVLDSDCQRIANPQPRADSSDYVVRSRTNWGALLEIVDKPLRTINLILLIITAAVCVAGVVYVLTVTGSLATSGALALAYGGGRLRRKRDRAPVAPAAVGVTTRDRGYEAA